MLVNCLHYTFEIVKYYLIMKDLLGFKLRKNYILQLVGMIGIIIFSGYITYTKGNPLFAFLLFVLLEMFILIKGKLTTLIFTTMWLIFIIGMIDDLFYVVVEMFLYGRNVNIELMDCIATTVTMIFLVFLVILIKKKTKEEYINISKVYYVYFTVLTLGEGLLISILKIYVNGEEGLRALALVLLCTLIMLINIVVVLLLALSNNGYKQRDELNRRFLKTQSEHYIYLKEKNEDIRKFKHDFISHIVTIRDLINQGKLNEVDEYLQNIDDNIHISDKKIFVNNGVVDAILSQGAFEAEKQGISMEVDGEFGEECSIKSYDICVIFANAVSNAIEAAAESEEKVIKIKMDRDADGIEILFENSYVGDIKKEDDVLHTTKQDSKNHGYGLKNIRESLNKYKGSMSIKITPSRFYLNMYIPMV